MVIRIIHGVDEALWKTKLLLFVACDYVSDKGYCITECVAVSWASAMYCLRYEFVKLHLSKLLHM